MKNLLTLSFFILTVGLFAQPSLKKIKFDYDDAGNQTRRYVCACISQQPQDTLPMILGADSSLQVNITPATNAQGEQEVKAQSRITAKELAQVFPNPTAGDINIHLENYGEVTSCSVEIRDGGGRIIYSSHELQPMYSLSLSDHPAGTYFVRLTVNGKQGKYTIVKQ